MTLSGSTSAGVYDGATLGLYPVATELISGAAFVTNADGLVFDSRDSQQTRGRLTVVGSGTAGILAYASAGVLANLAPLTGQTIAYPLSVIALSDDDRQSAGTSDVSSSASCSDDPASASVFSVVGCAVSLGALHTAGTGSSALSVSASYGASTTSVAISVYRPTTVSVSLDDPTLNKFADSSAAPINSCGSAFPYQRTKATAFADALDATELVVFGVSDASVAAVSSSKADMIEGRQAGSATVYPQSTDPSGGVTLTVTDTPVTVVALISRVVTSVTWTAAPPTELSYGAAMGAAIFISNAMTAEGDSGFMFSRIQWSDGAEHDVGYT